MVDYILPICILLMFALTLVMALAVTAMTGD